MEFPSCTSFSSDKVNVDNNELEELGMIDLNIINILMTKGEITKIDTLSTTFQKPGGEANMYAWFGYGLLKMY